MSIGAGPEVDEGYRIGNSNGIAPRGEQRLCSSSCALIAAAVQVALGDCRYCRYMRLRKLNNCLNLDMGSSEIKPAYA